jgi:murein hydrolase activator
MTRRRGSVVILAKAGTQGRKPAVQPPRTSVRRRQNRVCTQGRHDLRLSRHDEGSATRASVRPVGPRLRGDDGTKALALSIPPQTESPSSAIRQRAPAVVWGLLLALALAPWQATAQIPVPRDIAESQARLEQIRREQAALRDEMTRIRSRVTDLSSEVNNLSSQVGSANGLLQELEFQIDRRSQEAERNSVELLNTRDRLVERRAVLLTRLREIYKRGPLQTLEVLLTAESFSDLMNRYRYLLLVAARDRNLAEDVENLETELVRRERSLRANLAALESVREERGWEHAQLSALQQQQRQALTSVQTREQITAGRLQQLATAEAALAETLGLLENRRREAEAVVVPAGAPAAETSFLAAPTLSPTSMGLLPWPVEGSLVYGFGRQSLPNGTFVRWNGIGIAATAGSEVRAVEAGIVALAGLFEGYGPTVILSHGGGYYTLYLYLSDISVAEGQMAGRGQRLGVVGGATPSEGNRLEFQIRVPGGQAVDPLPWLLRR